MIFKHAKRKILAFIAVSVLIFAFSTPAKAQVLKDTSTFNMVCRGVDYIYDLQFTKASEISLKIESAYPGHPINYIFKGLLTYWENYPLTVSSSARASFETDMLQAIELCEKGSHPDDQAEYLLCNIGARGMLLLFYADNSLSMDVIPLASSTYKLVRETFDYTGAYADFYFFTGLYNYYRDAYPEAHPVYKPLALLFHKGDRVRGLKELQIASKRAIVLKAEAYSFLAAIYMNFENNFPEACSYSKSLHELYPDNIAYLAEYIKNLLLVKKYDEAETLIRSNQQKKTNAYFQAQLTIFNGILYEKKYHDLKLAQAYYTKGIRDISVSGDFGNDFEAFAYFGLSRISDANNDKHSKKIYRKQALDLASFKKVNFDE